VVDRWDKSEDHVGGVGNLVAVLCFFGRDTLILMICERTRNIDRLLLLFFFFFFLGSSHFLRLDLEPCWVFFGFWNPCVDSEKRG